MMNRRVGPKTLIAGCALLTLGGCSANRVVGQRDHGPTFGRSQGASSAVVFDAEPVAERLAVLGPGQEYGRLDHMYASRTQSPITSIDSWPTAPKTSIDSRRWLVLPRSPGNYVYFRKDPASRRRR